LDFLPQTEGSFRKHSAQKTERCAERRDQKAGVFLEATLFRQGLFLAFLLSIYIQDKA